jgi:hypothetical protein
MKEMLMLLAATMSKEETIERLTESLDEYKEAVMLQNEKSIEQAEQHLFLSTNLFMMHVISKGDIKNAISHIDEMKNIEKAHNFFKTDKN